MSNGNQNIDIKIDDVGKALQSMLDKIVTDLTTGVQAHPQVEEGQIASTDSEPRMFFPEGIELIDVIFKIGGANGADVEVKIAGAKGIQPASPKQDPQVADSGPSDVSFDVSDGGKGYQAHKITWTNRSNGTLQLTFDIDGSPLEVCEFKVPGNGGSKTTKVVGPAAPYDYHIQAVGTGLDSEARLTAKVIIQ